MSFGGFLVNAFLGAVAGGAASVAEKAKEEARLARERELQQEARDFTLKQYEKEQAAADTRLQRQLDAEKIGRDQDFANRIGVANMQISAEKDRSTQQHKDRMEEIGAQHANEQTMFDKKLALAGASGELSDTQKEQVKYLQEELKFTRSQMENTEDESKAALLRKHAEDTQLKLNQMLKMNKSDSSGGAGNLEPKEFESMAKEVKAMIDGSKSKEEAKAIAIAQAARRYSSDDTIRLIKYLSGPEPESSASKNDTTSTGSPFEKSNLAGESLRQSINNISGGLLMKKGESVGDKVSSGLNSLGEKIGEKAFDLSVNQKAASLRAKWAMQKEPPSISDLKKIPVEYLNEENKLFVNRWLANYGERKTNPGVMDRGSANRLRD